MARTVLMAMAFALLATAARGQEVISCRGNITSIQGEGLVHRTYRFEVSEVKGIDLATVLERCRELARDRQNKAARQNPGGSFRKMSDVNLDCVRGTEKFDVRRTIQTSP